MDLKQLEYMIMIESEKNISKAAKKLYITQSALNQQLLKLEKTLGTPLFNRNRKDCIPTEAGRVYLETAHKILALKKEAYNKISDIGQLKKGRLSIGFTSGRATTLFSYAYPIFHQLYPNIIVEPVELSVKKQQKLISLGELDIGFQTLNTSQRTHDEYIVLNTEELYLVTPEGLLEDIQKKSPKDKFPTLPLKTLESEPFVLLYSESTMRDLVNAIFKDHHFDPHLLFETSNMNIIINMVKAGSCCSIVPHDYLPKDLSGIDCYHLEERPTWDIVASYKKGSYLSNPAKAFIKLIEDFWEEL